MVFEDDGAVRRPLLGVGALAGFRPPARDPRPRATLPGYGYLDTLGVVGGKLYFSVNGDLWTTDGNGAEHAGAEGFLVEPDPGEQAGVFGIPGAGGITCPTRTRPTRQRSASWARAARRRSSVTSREVYRTRLSPGRCSTSRPLPGTRAMRPSSGRPTAPRRIPGWSRTSAQSRPPRAPPDLVEHRWDPVLHGGRERRAGPALDVRRHQRGHHDGAGPGRGRGVGDRDDIPRHLVQQQRGRGSCRSAARSSSRRTTGTHGDELWSDGRHDRHDATGSMISTPGRAAPIPRDLVTGTASSPSPPRWDPAR